MDIDRNTRLAYDSIRLLYCGLDPTLSVESNILKSTFQLFPNPAEGFCYVQVPNNWDNSEISIRDITGRDYKTHKILKTEGGYKIINLQTGTYLIGVTTAEGTQTKKLIVVPRAD